MSKGLFFSFEGVEGAGKSTQIERLAQRLQDQGRSIVRTREPGGTPLGEQVRRLLLDPDSAIEPEAEVLLFAASRAQLVRTIVRPSVARGDIVLCDRFVHSSLAYQGAGRGLGADLVWRANADALGGTLPDRVLVIDVDTEPSLMRARHRAEADRIEALDLSFHDRVAWAFRELARQDPGRVVLVNGRGEPDQVADRVWNLVSPLLDPR